MSRKVGQLTFDDCRQRAGRGGPRPGAGRPPGPRPRVHHVRRPEFSPRHPAHVSLRLRSGLPSLRRRRFLRQLQPSLRRLREREDFRLVHYSVQRDHLHLIVEADSRWAFGRGMRALGQRVAHAVNRACRRRGPVLDGRYHLRVLSTPRQVRNALAYVLLNARKHGWGRGRRSARRGSTRHRPGDGSTAGAGPRRDRRQRVRRRLHSPERGCCGRAGFATGGSIRRRCRGDAGPRVEVGIGPGGSLSGCSRAIRVANLLQRLE
ncbi:MAG: transposase [Proteobacteria bacterium]|nr:transposase [Pseudomonadota bacterium]